MIWTTPRIGLFAGPQGVRSYDLRTRRPLASATELSKVLEPLRGSKARLEVVLSDAHCRYLVMTRPEGIRSREELSAAVRNRFHAAFGDTQAWQLSYAASPFNELDFVAGVDETRLRDLEEQARAAQLALVSVRPHWVAWARHFRRQTRRGAHWIVVPDTEWLSLGYIVNGRCQQARALRLGAHTASLTDLLARERAFVEDADPGAAVWLAGGHMQAPTSQLGAAVTQTSPEALWGIAEARA
ncbi:MAG: hypothetical protein Tsb007_01630 [Rhizobacter sp.]